jgi:acyl-CoA synthetase (AMP-forming)/AMP-acid ligase II
VAVSAHDPAIALHDNDPHVIRFSAGTTGKPKGILHTVAGDRRRMSHHVREAKLVHGRVRFVDEGQGPVLLLLHGWAGTGRTGRPTSAVWPAVTV